MSGCGAGALALALAPLALGVSDEARRRALLTFVVVGGGPTGVELAGALGEIANDTLRNDFRSIDPRDAQIILVEAMDRVLPTYPPDRSASARLCLDSRIEGFATLVDAAARAAAAAR